MKLSLKQQRNGLNIPTRVLMVFYNSLITRMTLSDQLSDDHMNRSPSRLEIFPPSDTKDKPPFTI